MIFEYILNNCQVRVVRFYQRCSPHPPRPPPLPPPPLPPPVSPRPCLHQLLRPLPPCQLFANLFANFRAQWALLDLNCRLRPCQLCARVIEGNLRLRLAYGLLTPRLRQFPISDSDSVNFGLMFKQYREESSIRSGLLSLYAMA